jgi:acyl dehydratase
MDSGIGDRARRIEEYSRGHQLVFDEIEVGMEFPEVVRQLSPEICRRHCEVVGAKEEVFFSRDAAAAAGYPGLVAPPSVVCMYGVPSVLLSGYEPKVIPPPGNVHYRQTYEFRKVVRADDRLTIRSTVAEKEIRRDRKHVTIESEYRNREGERVAVGRITAIWSK